MLKAQAVPPVALLAMLFASVASSVIAESHAKTIVVPSVAVLADYPERAFRVKRTGDVLLECAPANQHLALPPGVTLPPAMTAPVCSVVSESPRDFGFADAALRVVRKHDPAAVAGALRGGPLRFAFAFRADFSQADSNRDGQISGEEMRRYTGANARR